MITTLSPTRNIMGYSYLCAISTDFINQKLKSSMLYVVIISILFFAVILLLSFVTTKSHNEIVTKNTLLEQKHMIISPFIRKKLLADFLNSSTDSSYGNSYGEYKRFEFNYEYFCRRCGAVCVFFNAFFRRFVERKQKQHFRGHFGSAERNILAGFRHYGA
ncbi:MAG: hypothetical protein L6V93_21790 [Clostridiales bacterium]|nr:MAG: hypothetical protein L6V93_21790 [Clostridiales bacterium]